MKQYYKDVVLFFRVGSFYEVSIEGMYCISPAFLTGTGTCNARAMEFTTLIKACCNFHLSTRSVSIPVHCSSMKMMLKLDLTSSAGSSLLQELGHAGRQAISLIEINMQPELLRGFPEGMHLDAVLKWLSVDATLHIAADKICL